ncbi:hypothetical protein VTN00DRAFT_966 [Thermoascus crustaceus]|uniref:uncharacterized protein n=1 Tax=Thermoascus crustaceus TaxID=5088 RepID=UPI0037425863
MSDADQPQQKVYCVNHIQTPDPPPRVLKVTVRCWRANGHAERSAVFSVQKHISRTDCILGTKLKLETSHFNTDLAETAALSAMKLPSHIHMYPSSTT